MYAAPAVILFLIIIIVAWWYYRYRYHTTLITVADGTTINLSCDTEVISAQYSSVDVKMILGNLPKGAYTVSSSALGLPPGGTLSLRYRCTSTV